MELKTVIETVTGKEICATYSDECLDNETLVPELRTVFYIVPYFNFETREFYEGATQQEIDDYNAGSN